MEQENVTLLKEINELRREGKASKAGANTKPKGRKDAGGDVEPARQAQEAASAALLQQVEALQQQLAACRLALSNKCVFFATQPTRGVLPCRLEHAHSCAHARSCTHSSWG